MIQKALVLSFFCFSCAASGNTQTDAKAQERTATKGEQTKTHAGHEPSHAQGHHRFEDAEKWAERFEKSERDAWQRPDEVLNVLGLESGMRVADIGSATGYFPVRIAPMVDPGMVYGIDIEKSMVDYLNARAKKEGMTNLKSLVGAAEQANIPEPVDLILLVNTYHHIENRPTYFAALQAKLKPGGRLVIIDFKKDDNTFGPPSSMKLSENEVGSELAEAGYALDKKHTLLPHQYVLEFIPQP